MLSQARLVAPSVKLGRSWMAPEAKSEDLLYISDYDGVHVFSYPKGLHVGDITGFVSPAGLCSNKKGDVFVTDTPAYRVYEYAHGSTEPLKTLYDNSVDFGPFDCSVDPTTGNVAATNLDSGFVVVFPKAEERPKVYYPHTMHRVSMYMCAYDDEGDLFVDQIYNRDGRHEYIGELRKVTKQFQVYLLDPRITHPGGIQFDGKHVVIEDLDSHIVYRLRFSGTKAAVIGSALLDGTPWVEQYWIQGETLIGPDANSTVYFWKYPQGGSPVSSVQRFTLDVGSTVSLSP